MAKVPKVKVIATDETGKDFPFATKTLTAEFKGKAGKTYKISIKEPGLDTILVGSYTVGGSPPPPPPVCPPGQHLENGVCVDDVIIHDCPTGQHWDEAQQKCIDDVVPHECPAGQHWDEATQQCVDDSPPVEGLIYDSNTDIDWGAITGEFLKVTNTYGTFKPNGKYFRMKASGSPRMYLYPATKELVLEHDGKYGRAYFGVCNYASRIECEFKLENASHNISFKTRNRHQYADIVSGAPDNKRQGGQGSAFSIGSVDADCEIVHGTEISGPSATYPKLEVNKWYKVKFSQFDKNGKIHIVDELDRNDGQGFKVVNEGDTSPPSQFFNKAEFETWSEFWVRLNADAGGRLTFKNLRMYSL